jgi:linoleoyl-CoA desaturase
MKFKSKNTSDFFSELTSKVEKYISEKGGNRFGNRSVFLKGIVLIGLYISCYTVLLLFHKNPFLSVVLLMTMGFTAVMIVFNIVHDASHNVLFKKAVYNRVAVYFGDLMGMNSYIWDIRHNIQHHTFTNVVGGDILLDSVPLIRISPYQKKYFFQKYQAIYAPLLYAVYSIFWVFVLDFTFFLKKEMGNIKNIRHSRAEWLKLFFFKTFYLAYMIVIPVWFFNISVAHVIAGFFIYHAAAGLLLSSVVVMGHCVEDVQYVEPDANGVINNSWMQHEWDTTSDCATNSRLLHWISGGLNTHLAHHLYPKICHCHYYDITRIIKEHCKEKEVRYPHHNFTDAIISHFRFLQKQAIA